MWRADDKELKWYEGNRSLKEKIHSWCVFFFKMGPDIFIIFLCCSADHQSHSDHAIETLDTENQSDVM